MCLEDEFELYQAFVTNNPGAKPIDVYAENELHRHYRVGNKYFVAVCRPDGGFVRFRPYLTMH